MIKIKTPATSANIGIGYDTLGLALNIYNEFTFQEAKENKLIGFEDTVLNDNLVYKSYKAFCDTYQIKEPKNVEISLTKYDIPISRGMGSSASCILAGVLAANYLNKENKSLFECTSFASKLEGHPDNVFASSYGQLCAVFEHDNKYTFDTFEVSNNLNFYLLIPSVKGSTEELRGLVPSKLDTKDAVHNLSRIIHLPKAFKEGDTDLLKVLLNDKIHEPYRYTKILDANTVRKVAKNHILLISGSGPSLLAISDRDITQELNVLSNNYTIVETTISNGVEIEVTL